MELEAIPPTGDEGASTPLFASATVHHVTASREGRVGSRTATGLVIGPDTLGCALPSTKALHKSVYVSYGNTSILISVLDVGPWFEHDDAYVFGGAMPCSEVGAVPSGEVNPGTQRPARNRAAIDLFDASCRALGVVPESWGLREVNWRFVDG